MYLLLPFATSAHSGPDGFQAQRAAGAQGPLPGSLPLTAEAPSPRAPLGEPEGTGRRQPRLPPDGLSRASQRSHAAAAIPPPATPEPSGPGPGPGSPPAGH